MNKILILLPNYDNYVFILLKLIETYCDLTVIVLEYVGGKKIILNLRHCPFSGGSHGRKRQMYLRRPRR